MDNLIGQTIGQYKIIGLIGEGGMATVYRAHQESLEREVALKVLLPHLTRDATFIERFLQEARAAAKMTHPNIVTVYEVGAANGVYYIALAYIKGVTLAQLMQAGPLHPTRIGRIMGQIGSALDYAHRQGIIHRDIKPGNILITEGDYALLTDFGIAKAIGEMKLTRTGLMVGTPAYMSPEQSLGKTVTPHSDQYSLGIVAYETLTGRVPFMGDTAPAILFQHVHEPPNLTGFGQPYQMVLQRVLAKDASQRFTSVTEFATALQAATMGQVMPLPPPPKAPSRTVLLNAAGQPMAEPVAAGARPTPAPTPLPASVPLYTPTPWPGNQGVPAVTAKPSGLFDFIKTRPLATAIVLGLLLVGLGWFFTPGNKAPVAFTARLTQDQAVRAGPGEEYAAFATLVTGASVWVDGRNERGSWWRIAHPNGPNGYGWIDADNAKIEGNNNPDYLAKVVVTPPKVAKLPTFTSTPTAIPPTNTPKPLPTATPIPPPPAPRAPAPDMVLVPAGEFTMGSDSGEDDEKPVHKVTLDAFYIDKYEVTNGKYAECVGAGKCTEPHEKKSYKRNSYYGNAEYNDYPVIYVDWKQAKSYCEWRGGRLPTEAEWEKAARGTDGRTYPWGNQEPTKELLNFNMNVEDTTKVGSYPGGASPYGAMDMAGNVWEWVSSEYKLYPYKADDGREDLTNVNNLKVLRGGSWIYDGSNVRAMFRLGNDTDNRDSNIGFRCVVRR